MRQSTVTAKPRKTRRTRNPDRVTASEIDPSFYLACDALWTLDDDIEADDRDGMANAPFAGNDFRWIDWQED